MDITIHNPVTWHNLNCLRDYILEAQIDAGPIDVLINCDSGEMSIPHPISHLEEVWHTHRKKSFKRLKTVRLYCEKTVEGISFSLQETRAEVPLSSLAVAVLQETLTLLNQMGQSVSSAQEALNLCMCNIKMAIQPEIEMAWGWRGKIDRMEAEKLLGRSPIGTYVLREGDVMTRRMESFLQQASPFKIRCYVMTIVEEEQKISDKLLIQSPGGWTVYNDEPQLLRYFFYPLSQVIEKAGGLHALKRIVRAA